MQIKFNLTHKDYLLWLFWHRSCSIPTQLFLVGFAAFFAYLSASSILTFIVGFIIVYGGMYIAQAFFIVIFVFFGKHRSSLTNYTIELRDDSLHVQTPFVRYDYFWPGVLKIISRGGYLCVFFTSESGCVIPDRAFTSTEQRSQFLSTIKEKLRNTNSR